MRKEKQKVSDKWIGMCVHQYLPVCAAILLAYPRSHFRPAYVQVSRLYTFQPFGQSNWTKYVVLNPTKGVVYLFWLTFRQLISAKVNWIEQQNWPTCATENGDILYNASLTQLYFVCLLFNQIVHGRRHIPNFFFLPVAHSHCSRFMHLGRVCRLSLWKTRWWMTRKWLVYIFSVQFDVIHHVIHVLHSLSIRS